MAASTEPDHRYSNNGRSPADYTSMMLQTYIETLGRSSTAQVLDVGPVCNENIMFFAQRLKRLHVCDMFLRLNCNAREGLAPEKVWQHLDYAPHSFDGINLWDFMDHLNDDGVGRLVNLCHTFLKPKGMMIVTSFEAQSAPLQINSFVIRDRYRLTFRLQNHLELPSYYRTNRALTNTLSAFPSVKSFLYRNGVREFLCKRD